jgi:MFS family permease
MTGRTPDEVPWRTQGAVYGIGLFSTSIFHMAAVVVPLYVSTLDVAPAVLGVVFAAPHFLPLLFSIHAGSLMDRLGARRVMVVCTLIGALTPLFYPAVSWVWALVACQMFFGFSESMGWLGAQTMIGQYMHGRTSYAGRMSFIIRFGHLVAPPMAGAMWDVAGPWGAFGIMSVWASGSVVCALLLPPKAGGAATGEHAGRGGIRALLPRPSDYFDAFRLLGAPAVAVVVILGGTMHIGNAVQSSFYPLWLKDMGITGTAIGTLISISSIGAAFFSLLTARATRYVPSFWVLLLSLWAGIVLISVTPLLGSYVVLAVALFLRSGANGLAQPLVITLVLRGAGSARQGKAIGLRGTANRIASIISPILMGALVQALGLEKGFYAIGALASLVMAALGIFLWCRPDVARSGED